jgi:transcriptional regulator with XRE-family HTH domain
MARPLKKLITKTYAERIGRRIRDRRLAEALSVQAAARRIRMPVGTWYGYELGRTSLPAQRLAEIAAALGCQVGDLLP